MLFIYRIGAHDRDRTGDLILTKEALYRLSYVGQPEKKNLSHGFRQAGRVW